MARLDWYIRANIKPRHMQLLALLDETRNLGKAAAQLNISQSAVSKSLSEIEGGVGLKLFERNARGVAPTIYGECLIKHSRKVLADLSEAHRELNALASGATGRLVVGALPVTQPGIAPRLIAALKQIAPGTLVQLREGTLDTLLPELHAGVIDVVLGTAPKAPAGNGTEQRVICEDDPILMISGYDSPLARKRKFGWMDAASSPWVLPPINSPMRELIEQLFAKNGVPMPVNYVETTSVPAIMSLLSTMNAVAIVSRFMAEHYVSIRRAAILPIPLSRTSMPLVAIRSSVRPMTPTMVLFLDCVDRLRVEMEQRPAIRGG
jgi:DNA-binding transcriptional LysR family regulator